MQTGLAAVVGVIIARELGRTAETDGFFAVVRRLHRPRARGDGDPRDRAAAARPRARRATALGRDGGVRGRRRRGRAPRRRSSASWPREPLAALLTGFGPEAARDAAAATLPWLVVAALGQLAAGLLASALAAMDDYLTPALGYVSGSLAGLALILTRIDADGIEAVAWGMALNAAIATVVPAVALGLRARTERMPAGAIRPRRGGTRRRAARAPRRRRAARSRSRRSTSSACRSPPAAASAT